MIYYDSVERNKYNKIFKLIKCIRGIESLAKIHDKGTSVYGTVVAQQHNQLVNAIINIQKTIGDLQDSLSSSGIKTATPAFKLMNSPESFENIMSMNAALANLSVYPPISDDACPDVEFIFNILSTDPNTEAEFCVRIYGNYLTYRLDFGDGTHTTTEFAGTHSYSVGATVNPVVTVTSGSCCITQQPVSNPGCCDVDSVPNPAVPFAVTIPDIVIPDFIAPSSTQNCPGPIFDPPPLIIPQLGISSIASCGDLCDILVSIVGPEIPSSISVIGCNFPSSISITGCCPPSLISIVGCSSISLIAPSSISIVGCDIPSIISVFCCDVPSVISVLCCDIPSVITFNNVPSFGPISFDNPPSFSPICFCEPPSFSPISFDNPPTISVDWGTPPVVSCLVFVQCCSSTPCSQTQTAFAMNNNSFMQQDIPVEIGEIGIPEEIRLIVPKINDVKLVHDIPNNINLKVPDIRITGTEDIPSTIRLIGELPKDIYINAEDVPRIIKLDASELPNFILVKPADNFPSFIEVKGIPDFLQVVGFPSTIEVKAEIKIVMPEDPFIELVYKGGPLEIKPVDFNFNIDISKDLKDIILVNANK